MRDSLCCLACHSCLHDPRLPLRNSTAHCAEACAIKAQFCPRSRQHRCQCCRPFRSIHLVADASRCCSSRCQRLACVAELFHSAQAFASCRRSNSRRTTTAIPDTFAPTIALCLHAYHDCILWACRQCCSATTLLSVATACAITWPHHRTNCLCRQHCTARCVAIIASHCCCDTAHHTSRARPSRTRAA